MEPRIISTPSRGGFILVTVLVITAIGLLFGAGALLLFRFQCQLRIDRQHELEKLYAVRSALNATRTDTTGMSDAGKYYRYQSQSGRDLGLLVKPVAPVFPDKEIKFEDPPQFHFDVMSNVFSVAKNQYNAVFNYEYGFIGTTNGAFKSVFNNEKKYELMCNDPVATNGVKWWVNIGMRGTGGWLQEDYGRRYGFTPTAIVGLGDSVATKDLIRLCLIRDVANDTTKNAGCRRGWPLSRAGEKALVFELHAIGVETENRSQIELYEYSCIADSSAPVKKPLLLLDNCSPHAPMGIQLAGDKASVFYVPREGKNPGTEGYKFSETKELSPEMYAYFSEPVRIGGANYPGVEKVNGILRAPEMRVILEIEAASNLRGNGEIPSDELGYNSLTEIRVTPAYQYDIYLEHPRGVTNRATVAQRIGDFNRGATDARKLLTYDTHGTENKGFRKDEKLAREGKK